MKPGTPGHHHHKALAAKAHAGKASGRKAARAHYGHAAHHRDTDTAPAPAHASAHKNGEFNNAFRDYGSDAGNGQ